MLDSASNNGIFSPGHLVWHRLLASIANLPTNATYPEFLEVTDAELVLLKTGDYLEEDDTLNCLVRKFPLKLVN